jgi:hypothetical protein
MPRSVSAVGVKLRLHSRRILPFLRVNRTNEVLLHISGKPTIRPEGAGRERRFYLHHRWRSSVGSKGRGHLHRDNKIAGEKIGEQVSERRRAPQVSGRNPSIRLAPFPTRGGNTLQPVP